MTSVPPRTATVVVLRGTQATPWELRQWTRLPARFDVAVAVPPSNEYDVGAVEGIRRVPVGARRDLAPRGLAGDLATKATGERYRALDAALAGAAIVHAEELSYWFTAEAARAKSRHGYKLVATAWETIPMLAAYRNGAARRHRELVLEATDLFLPATERAADALRLEGVEESRITVCSPGIDVERFGGVPVAGPDEHLILSCGRLVWEKGHQDLLRAVALLARGIGPDAGLNAVPRILIVGSGPERDRLQAHARELGIVNRVEIRESVPYDEMPAVFASASCLVLASLPHAGCDLVVSRPRCFWEEQFGMVLAEGMAAGLPLLVSESGAIPEVAGDAAVRFPAGDWRGLAGCISREVLARPPGRRAEHPRALVEHYSLPAVGQRLAAAYDGLLGS